MSEYYVKELERMLKQATQLNDTHNTIESQSNINHYRKIVNSKIKLAPQSGESWEKYILKIQAFAEISQDVNWKTHVDNGYKTWHTHNLPVGCFMCNDQEFIRVLIQVMQIMADTAPKTLFQAP